MAFDEVKKTVVSAIETRLNNQIVGSFFISWCLFNWKAIATIVFPSSISLADRFAALEKLGYGGSNLSWDHLFWYPAYSTLIILFVIPPFSLMPEFWENLIQNLRNLIKKRFLKSRMILFSEHETETEELRNQISKLQQDVRINEKTFVERGNELKKYETDFANLKKETNNLEVQRDELQKAISDKEQTTKLLTTEKEASVEKLVKLQSDFDIQNTLLHETNKKLGEVEKTVEITTHNADAMIRDYKATIANKDKEFGLLKERFTSYESKIAQQDSELKQLKKNSRPLTAIEQLQELLKPPMQELNVSDPFSGEKFKVKILNPLANGLTDGLDTVSIDINILIDKLRTGKISKEELFDLRNKLIAGQKDNLKATMIIKNLSDAQKLLFPSKNK